MYICHLNFKFPGSSQCAEGMQAETDTIARKKKITILISSDENRFVNFT